MGGSEIFDGCVELFEGLQITFFELPEAFLSKIDSTSIRFMRLSGDSDNLINLFVEFSSFHAFKYQKLPHLPFPKSSSF